MIAIKQLPDYHHWNLEKIYISLEGFSLIGAIHSPLASGKNTAGGSVPVIFFSGINLAE